MEFITTDQRIAVENFSIGKIYTITFKNSSSITSACIGKGADYVMFQEQAPKMLFTLNMQTAATVDTIEPGTGSGTNDYDDLENKPQINSVTLSGNKSSSDLGLQDTISDLATIRIGASAGATAVQPAALETALATKQDTISDLATIRIGASAGATAVQPAALEIALSAKQDIIDSSHKLSADLVDDANATNKFATAAQLLQIDTNKNNILSKCVPCTCSTAAATAAKVVDAPSGFVLQAGCIIGVKFSYSNTADNVTLNVGGTGAKPISYSNNYPYTGHTAKITGTVNNYTYYMYNGEYWAFIAFGQINSALSQTEASAGKSNTERFITAKVLSDTIDEKIQPLENNILYAINTNGKNHSPVATATAAGASFIIDTTAVYLPAGTYIFAWTGTASTQGTTINVYDSTTTRFYNQQFSNHAGKMECEVTLSQHGSFITLYTTVANNITNFMICDKQAYLADSSYTPYCPTNAELYALIRSYHP